MKTLHLLGILLCTLCLTHHSYAKKPSLTLELTCEQKAAIVLQSSNDFKNYPPELIDKMLSYITPCGENYAENPSSAFAKGLLHLQKEDYGVVNGIYQELSRAYIEFAAKADYPPAVFSHAMNLITRKYKLSGGLANPNQAVPYFEEAIALGHKADVSNYVLGYITLKNLYRGRDIISSGTAQRAKRYFEKSKLPMAKHWLSIIHYFGLGTRQDKQKALQMLADNPILNSKTLLEHLQSQDNDWLPISAEERLACVGFKDLDKKPITLIGDSKTIFKGDFLEFDWLAKGVRRSIPITLTFDNIKDYVGYREASYELTVNGITTSGLAKLSSGIYGDEISILGSNRLILPLKRLYKDHPTKDSITYNISKLVVKEVILNNKEALIARVDPIYTLIEEFDERMRAPFRFILYPETTPSALRDSQDIALIEKTATNKVQPVLDKNFAVIAPNPIGAQFNITYTLDYAAEVQVAVYDFYGQQRINVPSQKNSSRGTQVITVDSSNLPSGTYVVQMTINGSPYSKTIVKL